MVLLGDICIKIGSGATPRGGKSAYVSDGISLIRSQNVHDFNFVQDGLAHISDEQANKLDNVIVFDDDILFNITGDSVAHCCIVPPEVLPARVNQHVMIIRVNKKLANPKYIQYLLIRKKEKLLSLSLNGATRKAITKSMMQDFQIDLPSLDIQNQVVELIDNFSKTSKLKLKINDKFDEFLRNIFAYFIKESKNNNYLKLDDIAYISKSKWKAGCKNNIVEHYSLPAFDEKKYPIMEESDGIASDKYYVNEESILVSKLNPSTKRIWRPLCITSQSICSTEFVVMNPLKKEYTALLYAIVNTSNFQKFLINNTTGTTNSRQRVAPELIMTYNFQIPDEEYLKIYSELHEKIDRCMLLNQKIIHSAELIRDCLIFKLLS